MTPILLSLGGLGFPELIIIALVIILLPAGLFTMIRAISRAGGGGGPVTGRVAIGSKYCSHCGQRIPDLGSFCPLCGQRLL